VGRRYRGASSCAAGPRLARPGCCGRAGSADHLSSYSLIFRRPGRAGRATTSSPRTRCAPGFDLMGCSWGAQLSTRLPGRICRTSRQTVMLDRPLEISALHLLVSGDFYDGPHPFRLFWLPRLMLTTTYRRRLAGGHHHRLRGQHRAVLGLSVPVSEFVCRSGC
jgi:hypothetical protein